MIKTSSPINILFWGTYDVGKPRLRILMRGLKENQAKITECHYDVWSAVEDKSQIKGVKAKLFYLVKLLINYPFLVSKFLVSKKPDVIFIGYLGHFDILILYPFAKLKGVPIVWDAFLSLYNTVVEDRKLIKPEHPLAHLLFFFEKLSCRAANLILLDTQAHADYFINTFEVEKKKVHAVFVGAEPEKFYSIDNTLGDQGSIIKVLFYGQFIPLHGIETIIQAAKLTNNDNIKWIIIGKGQEEIKIQKMLDDEPVRNLVWIPWVNYNELISWINKASICLGIFGDTDKASRVIPNKVFQIIMAGKPIITRDSPAITELLNDDMPGVKLIPPSDPIALVTAIEELSHSGGNCCLHKGITEKIHPAYLGQNLLKTIERVQL